MAGPSIEKKAKRRMQMEDNKDFERKLKARRGIERYEKLKAKSAKPKKSKHKGGAARRAIIEGTSVKKRGDWVSKLKKDVKKELGKKKPKKSTARTKVVSKELKKNLSAAEIKKLRGG